MLPGHLFTLDAGQWPVVAFVLAMTFFSGVLGGFFFGLTRAVRHGEGHPDSESIWTYEDKN